MDNKKMRDRIERVSGWTRQAVNQSFCISEKLIKHEEENAYSVKEMASLLGIREEDYCTWCSASHIFNLMEIAIIEQKLKLEIIKIL